RTTKPWSHLIEHMFEIGSQTRSDDDQDTDSRGDPVRVPGAGARPVAYPSSMLLSDRDLVAEIKHGQLQLDPFEPALVQPSSIDVRLDRWFRVFNNHLYTHIDPSIQQDELTSAVEVAAGQAFVLHPGEFVLASTLEVITLGD